MSSKSREDYVYGTRELLQGTLRNSSSCEQGREQWHRKEKSSSKLSKIKLFKPHFLTVGWYDLENELTFET